jgi:membrane protein
MAKLNLKGLFEVLKESGKKFVDDKVPKLSGSLAYTIVFSLAPLLVVIISLCGIFLGQEAVEGTIHEQLAGFLGENSAADLQEIIRKASLSGKSRGAAIFGGILLFVGATAVFAEIQDSINYIWQLKPKPKKGWLALLRNRFLSFSVIISLGFLLLVSLGLSAIIDAFSKQLKNYFPDITVILFTVINFLISFLVATLIFAVIFKVLPDAKIRWKDIWAGAITTGILFLLGKFGISFYISKSAIGETYGAAGSIVILLVWIYYSAFILYFGAEFTRAYALRFGSEIVPGKYAVSTKVVEVEQDQQSLNSPNPRNSQ